MVTSLYAVPSSFSQSPNVRETSAMPSGGRVSVPEKMTSFISPPPQGLGRLLAEDPADGVENVAFAAAVGADNGGDARVKFQGGTVREGLETNDVERLQIHGVRCNAGPCVWQEIPQLVVVLLDFNYYLLIFRELASFSAFGAASKAPVGEIWQ